MLRLALCCALAGAASQTSRAQVECTGSPSCYTVAKGAGNCSSACIGACDAVRASSTSPLTVDPSMCQTLAANQTHNTFHFLGGTARPGYLSTSSSVSAGTNFGLFVVMGGSATFRLTDVVFTGPAGATSVDVTWTMILDASPNWEVTLTLGNRTTGMNANSPAQGQLVTVTSPISLDGGSPVSQSRPQTIIATVLHREITMGGATGTGRLKVPHGCNAPVFAFSLPGCSASSVSGGIIANRLTPVPICCPADYNDTSDVSVQDIFDFLAAYFASDPSADFNASNGSTVQDIFDFLGTYFTGCA